jgi:hypothetical protein
MRLGVTILLTDGGRDGRWKASYGITARLKLPDGEGSSQWLSGNGEGTYECGGAQRR